MILPLRNNYLGCSCQIQSLGAVANYDVLIIGGQRYTANQILDKKLIATVPTKIFRADLVTVIRTVPAGQVIGQVFSYLKPSSTRAKGALMLYDNSAYTGTPYYVLDETPVDTAFLKDQGTMTVTEEIKAEALKAEKDNDPISYYFKKLAIPVLIGGAGVSLVATYGKEFIKDKLLKKAA